MEIVQGLAVVNTLVSTCRAAMDGASDAALVHHWESLRFVFLLNSQSKKAKNQTSFDVCWLVMHAEFRVSELGRHRHHFWQFFSYEAIEDDQQSCTELADKGETLPKNEQLAPLGFTSDLWDLPRIYGMKWTAEGPESHAGRKMILSS